MSGAIRFQAVRDWCLQTALPLWADIGVDRVAGGYVEALDLTGAPLDPGFKRTRVTARQIYCFAQSVEMGFAPGRALVEHGMEFLARTWQGPERGWPRSVTRAGAPLDTAADLYDCAFALFACAWAGRVLDRPEPAYWAGETLDFITTHLAHPGGRGYIVASDARGPRQQNPHMHLLEAAIAAHETFGGSRFAELADDILRLARDHFIDPASGALREFFTEDWAPAPGADGALVEPGHCFEWAWILAEHMRLTNHDHANTVLRLVAYAEAHGVDPASQVTFDAVALNGGPLQRGSRTWPNTERIKGWLAAGRLGGPDPRPAVAGSVDLLLKRYLNVSPPGAWMDRFDAAGQPVATTIPASTLYHVLLAFAQLLGEEDALSAPG